MIPNKEEEVKKDETKEVKEDETEEVKKDETEEGEKDVEETKGCTIDEILAILSHELGHWYYSHTLKNLILVEV